MAQTRYSTARDYVEGMWRILQQEEPEDFVLATGEMHSVREFVEKAFAHVSVKVRYAYNSVFERAFADTTLQVGKARVNRKSV